MTSTTSAGTGATSLQPPTPRTPARTQEPAERGIRATAGVTWTESPVEPQDTLPAKGWRPQPAGTASEDITYSNGWSTPNTPKYASLPDRRRQVAEGQSQREQEAGEDRLHPATETAAPRFGRSRNISSDEVLAAPQ